MVGRVTIACDAGQPGLAPSGSVQRQMAPRTNQHQAAEAQYDLLKYKKYLSIGTITFKCSLHIVQYL
jgi:hypothetical protein